MFYCHMLQVIAQRDTRSSFQGPSYWSETAPLHSVWETLPFWAMLVTSLRCIPFRCIPEVNCLFLAWGGRSKKHKAVKEVTLAWAVRFLTIPMIPMSWLCFNRVAWQYRPHLSLQPLLLCWVFTQVTVHLHGFQWDCAEGHKHRRALVQFQT